MLLSRAKPANFPSQTLVVPEKKKMRELSSFIAQRDYTGAITLLQFLKNIGKDDADADKWLGYCHFHLGEYLKAKQVYERIITIPNYDLIYHIYHACCCFLLGMYKEADEEAQKGPPSKLQNRIFFHLSHKFGDEKRLMVYHQNLQDLPEDQMTLASIHYLRNHYEEAIDIYKRLLLENKEHLALNVYVGMCYYKLDYFDVAQEVLTTYLLHFPDSVTASNLKACIIFKLYNGKAAETELKLISDSSCTKFAQDLINHNLCVFKGGEGAMSILPDLVDVLPEARLNLVIYHMKNNDALAAFNLMSEIEPSTPQEYTLKGIVNVVIGQQQGSKEHLKVAQQYFQLVGNSPSECDTIPGRQCLASAYFIMSQFDEVLTYLDSIKAYFFNDCPFNLNYGQTKCELGEYTEGLEALLMVKSEHLRKTYTYISHLAKCYIHTKNARLAWETYLAFGNSSDSFNLLILIGNECYKTSQYFYAAKAFDVLEKLDQSPEFWEGKRGACVGVYQKFMSGLESRENFEEVIHLLKTSENSQVEYLTRIMLQNMRNY